jgi:hypothetical protein
VEHVGRDKIAAEFGSTCGYGIRQSAGYICSTNSFEFRSLSLLPSISAILSPLIDNFGADCDIDCTMNGHLRQNAFEYF